MRRRGEEIAVRTMAPTTRPSDIAGSPRTVGIGARSVALVATAATMGGGDSTGPLAVFLRDHHLLHLHHQAFTHDLEAGNH